MILAWASHFKEISVMSPLIFLAYRLLVYKTQAENIIFNTMLT